MSDSEWTILVPWRKSKEKIEFGEKLTGIMEVHKKLTGIMEVNEKLTGIMEGILEAAGKEKRKEF